MCYFNNKKGKMSRDQCFYLSFEVLKGETFVMSKYNLIESKNKGLQNESKK